ncbi:AAA family ATPase [Nostocoides sp. F2B08]|uniref:ATP-dependent nuclease n=1 Tax=Nostocoides sp. F2B08 TaxID=2653936 RepID=UPI001262FED6|nr:AAA family ATPase [Tetrasphaera sp. F2B08]KAB7744452.1 AAA family ATPase [Tetrasphaera sp. F2B08]
MPVPPEGTVLFVGPNNAGKSQSLKDLMGHIKDTAYQGKTLTSLKFSKEADEPIDQWIDQNLPKQLRDGILRYQVPGWGEVQVSDIVGQWNKSTLNAITQLFVFHADGTSRLSAGDSQQSLDFSTSIPAHPVQRAYLDSSLEAEIDRESRAAFGVGVTVDRYAGSVISLRVGDRPEFSHQEGRPSDEYLRLLKRLPKLEEQGDGVRSYLGLVAHIAAGQHQILLIDEPEAFLHPPQARRLGRVLAGQAHDQQAFIATHSADVVQGALEHGSSITIVRITREADVNHAAVLDDAAVKKLWSDPLLRYSNVLDGLFHDAVVLCESDADCRYYSSVLDNLSREDALVVGAPADVRDPQILFTHCGGKARIPSVVTALRAVSVPVIVVADFDVLREETDMRRIVASLGGDFSEIEADLREVTAALRSDVKPLRKVALKDELVRRIDSLPNDTVTTQEADGLRSCIKAENGWDKAKRAGIGAVPQGRAHQACQRVLEKLADLKLLVVPIGELERFAPGVSGHGPAWVTAVLEERLHETPGAEAQEFVAKIRNAAQPI